MESKGSLPEPNGQNKFSSERVAELYNTCITGLGILRDAAHNKGSPEERLDEVIESATEDLDEIACKARSGNAEAFSQLKVLAGRFLKAAGGQDADPRSGQPSSERSDPAQPASEGELPEHVARIENYPENPPKITAREVTEFINSRDIFLVARSNYQRRRAQLVYELQCLCKLEEQGQEAQYILRLDDDGDTIRIVDQSGVEPETIIDRR